MENQISEERSLAETPTWSVATVTTVMVAVCFLVERSIYRFGMWLKKTKRKALLASLEKIKEELMLLGLISLMLGQWARWISEICMPSMLFSSRFYSCSEQDFQGIDTTIIDASVAGLNSSDRTFNLREGSDTSLIHCRAGHEPFVSYESLEQLHRFLFVLGITHVFYSCFAVVLAMIKIYSWRKWEPQANPMTYDNLQSRRNTMMKRQSTFIFHHASHPWSKNRILIWMLCFVRQFKSSIEKSDYMALRLGFISYHNLPLSYDFHKYMVRGMEDEFHGIVGIRKLFINEVLIRHNKMEFQRRRIDTLKSLEHFSSNLGHLNPFGWPLWGYAILCIFINLHGLNIYFWLSFIPALLILLVGTKLQHVVAKLALEIVEATDPSIETQLRPRDDLFWFRKPELLLCLIQFISFQNAFEMAIFIWSLGGIKARSCFMKNRLLVVIRLVSGVLVQFWCSYSTVPLNVIITEMGSKFKKSLISESVRESLHDWCRRVKEKSKRESLHSHLGTTRSTCSLESTVDERDEIVTVVSGCLSRTSSMATQRSISLKCVNAASVGQETGNDISCELQCDLSLQLSDYSSSFPEDNVSLMVHPSTRSEIETDDD